MRVGYLRFLMYKARNKANYVSLCIAYFTSSAD